MSFNIKKDTKSISRITLYLFAEETQTAVYLLAVTVSTAAVILILLLVATAIALQTLIC
jgi:hypothetical protein